MECGIWVELVGEKPVSPGERSQGPELSSVNGAGEKITHPFFPYSFIQDMC